MKLSYKYIATLCLLGALIILLPEIGFGQGCAMCKAALTEKTRNKESNLAEGLNFGILYLMSFPYLIFGVIAYFWYKNSRKGNQKGDVFNKILDKVRRKK
jgi:hypothetical protein